MYRYLYYSLLMMNAVWLLIIIRHYKKEYYYFFLIAGCEIVTTFFFWKVFHYNTNAPLIFFSLLLIPALERNFFKPLKRKIIFVSFVAVVTIFNLIINIPVVGMWITLAGALVILTIFLKRIILSIALKSELNLIHAIFLLYYLSAIIRLYNGILQVDLGYFNFLVFNFLNIIIGIAFLFVNEDTKIFKFKSLDYQP